MGRAWCKSGTVFFPYPLLGTKNKFFGFALWKTEALPDRINAGRSAEDERC